MKTKGVIHIILVVLFTISTSVSINAQSKFKPYWEIDLNGGISTFWGDLKQNTIIPANNEFNEWKFGGSLMIGKQISPVFGLRAQILTGELLGGKAEIDRYFEANYYEGNINATINLNNLFGDYKADRLLEFYGVIGIGLTNFNSLLFELSTNNQLRYQGYGNGKGLGGRTLEGILIGGMGMELRLSDKMNLKLESANRAMNSDLLDIFEDDKKADFYNYTSLGLTYKFGYPKKKAKVVKEEEFPVLKPRIEEREIVEETVAEVVDEVKEEVEETIVEVEPEIIVEPEVKEEPEIFIPQIPEPEYRVQIRACYMKSCNVDELAKVYNFIVGDIMIDKHNNYYIYTIGSFATYNEARHYRDKIRVVNKVTDAFVVAFSNGKRLKNLPK